MPSSPSEAKGLLLSSVMSNDPIIFLEYRALYNTKEHVDEKPYFIKLGEPRKRLSGKDITVVAAGASVLTALQGAEQLKEKKVSIDLFDLRTINQIKMDKIFNSIKKTKKVLVLEDGWSKGGYASEVITMITEKGIKLDRKPKRICWPDSHLPMSRPLEADFYFTAKDVYEACLNLLSKK